VEKGISNAQKIPDDPEQDRPPPPFKSYHTSGLARDEASTSNINLG